MKPIKVTFDKAGNTLNVWFDDPQKEHVSEETGEEVVLIMDKAGKLIGFEVLNYLPAGESLGVETLAVEGAVLGVCAAGKITSSISHQMAQNAAEADGLSHHGAFLWHRSRTISHHEVPKSFWGADS